MPHEAPGMPVEGPSGASRGLPSPRGLVQKTYKTIFVAGHYRAAEMRDIGCCDGSDEDNHVDADGGGDADNTDVGEDCHNAHDDAQH